MPQIGWFEILIIVAVAIVVIGPKDFPIMLRKIGSWIGVVKRYVNNFQDQISCGSCLFSTMYMTNVDEKHSKPSIFTRKTRKYS